MNQNYKNEEDIPIIKIVVVGQSGVGKSNMISRFVHSKFFLGGGPTIGSEVDVKKITINKNQQVNLYIWDTAGQQRYRSVNKAFYRGALGALVIFDLGTKQTFENVRKWIQQIRSCTTQKIVLLLIGNKCDLKDHQVTVQEATQFARKQGMGYFQTSAALNINVQTAFQTLASKIYKATQKSLNSSTMPVFNGKHGDQPKNNSKQNCQTTSSITLNRKRTTVVKKQKCCE